MQRIGGQLRVTGSCVIGWDMGAALHLGAALGISHMAIAELLPLIEAVMVRKINEETRAATSASPRDTPRTPTP